jgi:hypothetical protein
VRVQLAAIGSRADTEAMNKLPIFASVAVALLTASVADARLRVVDPRRGPSAGPPEDCPLTVGFSSYGPGIDRVARANIEQLLDTDRGVRTWTRHPWGREGEVTLCVRTRTNGDAVRLARSIRALIPARPRGPIRVQLPFMRRY